MTRKNLMLLKLAQKGLQADMRDKKMAADIDSSIVRLRRQRANHRWVLDGNVTSTRPPPRITRDSTPPSSFAASGSASGGRGTSKSSSEGNSIQDKRTGSNGGCSSRVTTHSHAL